MRITLTTFFLLVLHCAFAQKSTTENRLAGLDTTFARVIKDWHVPGFAIAVVEKNKIVYAKGFGYRDIANKKPATANTLFAIGSCTKAFTATLLGMLRQDGLVDFDKPVNTYLPDLRFFNNDMNDKITLRDMMCHRTGLPRHDLSWYYFTTNSRDSLVQRIQYMEPSASYHAKWQYNNFMFMTQGVVVQKITGKSWEDNIKERIFTPLDMRNSDISIEEMLTKPEPATGYKLLQDSIITIADYYHINAMAPAGSINSSVSEMGNWLITWINGGKFNGKQIIPADYVKEAMSSQMVVQDGLPDKQKRDIYFANYGLAWFLSSYRGHYRVDHGGNIDGFSANTCFFPSDSLGIVVLTNQGQSPIPSIVRNIVVDKILGLKYYDWESDFKNEDIKAKKAKKTGDQAEISNRKLNTKPSHNLDDYAGLYNNKGYGTIEFTLSKDSLFALVGSHRWWMVHYQYDWFQPIEKDDKNRYDTSDKGDPIEFHTNQTGDIESVAIGMEPTLKPIVFTRIPRPEQLSKDSLQKFVGEYEIATVTMKVYLRGENTLMLFVPGQPEYELVPIAKNKFSLKSVSGFTIQFNANDKNEIVELLSIQPNGTFKATKKK